MDVTLQRHFAKYIYVIPEGLRELCSDISREVLRSQPEDLYTFIADYLDALMVTRENARVAAKLVADILEISETTAQLLQSTGVNRSVANKAATLIQKKFKKYLELKHPIETTKFTEEQLVADIIFEAGLSKEDANNSAAIIQKAFRNFLNRKEREKDLLSGMIDWRVAARSAIALYRKTGVTYQEVHRAATLIKAAYKGYYTRKVLNKLVEETKLSDSGECLCDQYSLEIAVPAPMPTVSEECICSIDSDELIGEKDSEECLCEYTSSEQILLGKKPQKKVITDEGFSPICPAAPDDQEEWCYCDELDATKSSKTLLEQKKSEVHTETAPVKSDLLLNEKKDENEEPNI